MSKTNTVTQPQQPAPADRVEPTENVVDQKAARERKQRTDAARQILADVQPWTDPDCDLITGNHIRAFHRLAQVTDLLRSPELTRRWEALALKIMRRGPDARNGAWGYRHEIRQLFADLAVVAESPEMPE